MTILAHTVRYVNVSNVGRSVSRNIENIKISNFVI
jgi:hypothetical protein